MRSSWPVGPLGEHNDPDPPYDAEPAREKTEAEVRIDQHMDRCLECLEDPSKCNRLSALIDSLLDAGIH